MLTGLCALAESYDGMWKKAQKAKEEKQYERAQRCVDDIYDRALKEGNVHQLACTLYAYDALGVCLTEDSVIRNAHRITDARTKERNATEHVLLTHILGRLTDSDHLLALSVADTTFLQKQPIEKLLPLIGDGSLFDLFTEYINERELPDSVFVGWETAAAEHPAKKPIEKTDKPAGESAKRPSPAPVALSAPVSPAPAPTAAPEGPATPAHTAPKAEVRPAPAPAPAPKAAPTPPPPPQSGTYTAYVFTVPEGAARVCLVESLSGTPVKQWTLKKDDGRGLTDNDIADGNGHVWLRPTQIHNFDGLYDWHLSPITAGEAQANTLLADNFHSGDTWGSAALHDEAQLKIDMENADPKSGTYSITIRAPHRNLTLMRDVTSDGKLIEQRQYAFSDFIHFNMTWKEKYGDKALVTFAYVFQGQLYEAQMTITRPEQ